MSPNYSSFRGSVKAAILLTAISLLIYVFTITYHFHQPVRGQLPTTFPNGSDPTIIATIPYAITNHSDLGNNFVPSVTTLVTINDRSNPITFLIDTGALITTIPDNLATIYSLDLESLPRIALSSLTAQTVFGYLTPATLLFNTQEVTLPVAFAAVDTALLGRQGFLDAYTLTFDHQHRQVIISTN